MPDNQQQHTCSFPTASNPGTPGRHTVTVYCTDPNCNKSTDVEFNNPLPGSQSGRQ